MSNILSLTAAPEESAPLTLQGIWDSVVYGVSWFFGNLSPAFFWALAGLAACAAFFVYYWLCLRPRPRSLEWIAMAEAREKRRRLTLTLPHHPMEKRDILPVLALTVVYAFTAFFQLGNLSGPQSVAKFQQGDSCEFSYDEPTTVDTISFYTSLGTGYYTLEWEAEDGTWRGVKLDQPYNSLFKWKVLDLAKVDENGEEVKKGEGTPIGVIMASRFRLTASSAPRDEGLWLAELALWSGAEVVADENGEQRTPLPTSVPDHVDAGGAALFDEHDLWASKSTYLNSSYFDEI